MWQSIFDEKLGSVENEANDDATIAWKRPRRSELAAVIQKNDGSQTQVAIVHAAVIHLTAATTATSVWLPTQIKEGIHSLHPCCKIWLAQICTSILFLATPVIAKYKSVSFINYKKFV